MRRPIARYAARHVSQHPPAPSGRGRRSRHHRRGAGRRPPVRPQDQRVPHPRRAKRGRLPGRRRGGRAGHGAAARRTRDRRRRGTGPVRGSRHPCGRSSLPDRPSGRRRERARGAGPPGDPRRPPDTGPGHDAHQRWARPRLQRCPPRRPPGGAVPAWTSSTGASRSTAWTSRSWSATTARRCSSTTSPAPWRTCARSRPRSRAPASRTSRGSRSRPARTRGSSTSCAAWASPARRRAWASTPARPARSCTRWRTAGAPRRSATPAPTSSERDLDVLLAHPIRLNLDGVSQIERWVAGRPAGPSASASTRAPVPATRSTSPTPASDPPSSA